MSPSSTLMTWYNGSQNSVKHLFLWLVIQNIKKDTDEQPDEESHGMMSGRVLSSRASIPVGLGRTALLASGMCTSSSNLV